MGRSFAESFLNAKILTSKQLAVIEKDHAQIQELHRMKIGQIYNEFDEYITEKDLIILAVKPQDAQSMYGKLKPFIREHHIVLTIMAGVQIAEVSEHLGTAKVVRTMPNLPCKVGLGVTGFMVSEAIPQKDIDFIRKLLETTGVSIQLYEEDKLNAITAISGSGPAYVFLFIEALEQAAIDLGLPAATARQLTLHTFLGAAALAIKDRAPPAELRARVTSKGGTTERGLLALEEGGVRYAIGMAARAAAERAREMGEILGKD